MEDSSTDLKKNIANNRKLNLGDTMLYGVCDKDKSVFMLALFAGLLTVVSKPLEKLRKKSKNNKAVVDFDFTFDFDDYIKSRKK